MVLTSCTTPTQAPVETEEVVATEETTVTEEVAPTEEAVASAADMKIALVPAGRVGKEGFMFLAGQGLQSCRRRFRL